MYYKFLLSFLFSFFIQLTNAQDKEKNLSERKSYQALRIHNSPKIDGLLEDEVWQKANTASNFMMVEPGDGDPVPPGYETDVKLLYNDEAIFIGAYMRSSHPDKTIKQFTQRDNIGLSEFFIVDINPYDDGENQTRFLITAAGTIVDGKAIGNNEDYTFNTVWEAEIYHDPTGWYAEIKIPYSAVRFPKKDVQLWGVQFARSIPHLNETYTWNYINKSVGKTSQYSGLVTGIENIDPPVRLSLYPYISSEIKNFEGQNHSAFNAGMDIKYGINDAFTLDATLVPDFGQVAFDDVELNLTPFEQQFGENRAFFTEGIELFSKGNLFYSRRVGDRPTRFGLVSSELNEHEIIEENPERTDLINAFKISGRTDDDLGIGFFNAITREMEAGVRDTLTGNSRNIVTEPLANYNILVLDQQFNKNSSISLINTNVTREGHFRDANVTGFLFDLYNKGNSFNFTGEAKVSQVNRQPRNVGGFASAFAINRTKGKLRYGISHKFANETYDINDFGINFTNNYNDFSLNTSYRIFEPTGIFNDYNIQVYGNHQRRYQPDIAVQTEVGASFFGVTRKRFAFGGTLEINSKFRDFFEPRRDGMFMIYNPAFTGETWISSDYRKTFAYDVRVGTSRFLESPQERYKMQISPRVRFNDRFTVIYSFNYITENDRQSFVGTASNDAVIFGDRDMESIENSLQVSYNFNTKQAVNLSFRNFWSTAHFNDGAYSILQENGKLSPANYRVTSENDPNANFNIWNLDLGYSWQFAPGSEAILLYRNSIFNQDRLSTLNYINSLENLFNQSLQQVLSLKIIYFIDYNSIKNFISS